MLREERGRTQPIRQSPPIRSGSPAAGTESRPRTVSERDPGSALAAIHKSVNGSQRSHGSAASNIQHPAPGTKRRGTRQGDRVSLDREPTDGKQMWEAICKRRTRTALKARYIPARGAAPGIGTPPVSPLKGRDMDSERRPDHPRRLSNSLTGTTQVPSRS
jgi:hypothetical protein